MTKLPFHAALALLAFSLLAAWPARSDEIADQLVEMLQNKLGRPGLYIEAAVQVDTALPAAWQSALGQVDLSDLTIDRTNGRFTATARLASAVPPGILSISGRAQVRADIPILRASITRGEIISDEAVEYAAMSVIHLPKDTVVDAAELIGKAARRTLRPDLPVRAGDLMAPIVVARNTVVDVVYESGAMRLTARGRALANGGAGDVISVLNIDSKRTIEATVLNPTTVVALQNQP